MLAGFAEGAIIERRLTRPVNVHPGTSRCTLVFASFRSKLKCSAKALTAAFDALYAALPGGFVMPCLLPVMTMALGVLDERDWKEGTYVLSPLITPKRFVLSICRSLSIHGSPIPTDRVDIPDQSTRFHPICL